MIIRFICFILLVVPGYAGDLVFLEKGGVVAIEAESTAANLGKWVKKRDVEGYSGECHLEFTGNTTINGPPKSALKYHFQIQKAGKYQLTLRARKRLETERHDISNDCYIAMKGDFASGGGAPLDILKEDTKMFGGNADGWGWCTSLDANHEKFPAIYEFKKGETYELTIHGRSKNFNLDRILIIHEGERVGDVQKRNPKESVHKDNANNNSFFTQRTRRTLTNAQGQTIDAELTDKTGDTVVIMARGIEYKIPISSLSEDDQNFIEQWEP